MSSSEPLLVVDRLGVGWGGRPVLRDLSFAVGPGELLALVGPNGSGKTTLLRAIAGLEPAARGRVVFAGRDLTGVPAHRRGLPLMFQDAILLPRRTVYENLAYAPLVQRRPEEEVRREVDRLVELLGLRGLEDRAPEALSGGERQRVALGRTLAARPRLVLLDEPFAAIDPEFRAELRAEFRRVLRAIGAAAVHVTHDREEAMFLGDRMGLLFDGTLEGLGAPEEVFRAPPSPRAARFLGYNVLPAPTGPVAVDPHDLELGPPGAGGLSASVVSAGPTGREQLAILEAEGGARLEWRGSPGAAPEIGTRVSVRWAATRPLPRASVPEPSTAEPPPKEPKSGGRLGPA